MVPSAFVIILAQTQQPVAEHSSNCAHSTQECVYCACRPESPDRSQVVPGAFVIILAQDPAAYWTFTLRQASLWLGRVVHVAPGCCKLHYFARCR